MCLCLHLLLPSMDPGSRQESRPLQVAKYYNMTMCITWASMHLPSKGAVLCCPPCFTDMAIPLRSACVCVAYAYMQNPVVTCHISKGETFPLQFCWCNYYCTFFLPSPDTPGKPQLGRSKFGAHWYHWCCALSVISGVERLICFRCRIEPWQCEQFSDILFLMPCQTA